MRLKFSHTLIKGKAENIILAANRKVHLKDNFIKGSRITLQSFSQNKYIQTVL